ncbi:MAG: NUDIX hydrolase [Parachlamydiaceae bacterium]|nr:NUDIX hydrolase [Parachlamydiaceae bacterium]
MEKFILSDTHSEFFENAIVCSGGYCTFKGKLLLLKRHSQKLFGNLWGVPGGKLEPGETPEDGLIREVYEEAGFMVDRTLIEPIHTLYIHSTGILSHRVIYHMFYCPLLELPELNVHLDEHSEAQWVTPAEGLELELVTAGGIEAIQIYRDFLIRRNAS